MLDTKGACIGLLLYSQDRLLSDRSLALAAYNVLSKVASAALILPISEAIGQLKWTWFSGSESKEMIDFEIFDKASRGAWGSFLLLYRTKGRSLAALGAVLTLLLLATDTFFQQATDYPDRWALEYINSSIPRVVRYEPFYTPEYLQGFETAFIDPALRPVVSQFMINNGTQPGSFANGTRPDIPFSCPSSNCTWPEYDTLAVCSKCVEVSDLLEQGCVTTIVDWSSTQTGSLTDSPYPVKTVCGFFLNITSKAPILMSGYILEEGEQGSKQGEALLVRSFPLTDMLTKTPILNGSVNFKNIRNPILDALIVSAADGLESVFQNVTPIAQECVLAWCVQTVRSSYALGNYQEDIMTMHLNRTTGSWPWTSYPVYVQDELVGNNVFLTEEVAITRSSNISSSDSPGRTYGLSNTTASNTMMAFDDYFPSYYTVESSSRTPMLRYKNYLDGPSLRKLKINPFLAPSNVSHHMERLATAITSVIRSDDSHNMITGQAYNRKQFIVVRWEWLTFPIALLILSLAFLVATIMKTSRSEHGDLGVWKTSAMPTLLYGLPEEYQSGLRGHGPEVIRGSKQTKKLRLQLLPKQGWRVSGHYIPSPTLFRRLNHQPPPGWI